MPVCACNLGDFVCHSNVFLDPQSRKGNKGQKRDAPPQKHTEPRDETNKKARSQAPTAAQVAPAPSKQNFQSAQQRLKKRRG